MPWNSICSSICESGPAQTLFHQKKLFFFVKLKQLDLFSLHPYHAQSKTLIFLPFPLKSNWLRFRLVSWVIPSSLLWSKTEIIESQKKSPCCRTNEMSPSTSTYDPIDSNKTNFNHHWDKKLNLSLMNNWSLSAFCLFLRCFGSKMFYAAEGIYKSLSTSLQRAPTMWTSTNDNSQLKKRLHSEKISILPNQPVKAFKKLFL